MKPIEELQQDLHDYWKARMYEEPIPKIPMDQREMDALDNHNGIPWKIEGSRYYAGMEVEVMPNGEEARNTILKALKP